jgi:tRNA threonylcarbamoyladenosine biosynthesis protein TsaE
MIVDISTLKQLQTFSLTFSQNLQRGDVVFLIGDLGSGKTTFTQFLLKQLGYKDRVKSPTYALYETYELPDYTLVHMDLYRLSSPEELYYLGIDEIFTDNHVVIIEWPEKGQGVIPLATKILNFEIINSKVRRLKIDFT